MLRLLHVLLRVLPLRLLQLVLRMLLLRLRWLRLLALRRLRLLMNLAKRSPCDGSPAMQASSQTTVSH